MMTNPKICIRQLFAGLNVVGCSIAGAGAARRRDACVPCTVDVDNLSRWDVITTVIRSSDGSFCSRITLLSPDGETRIDLRKEGFKAALDASGFIVSRVRDWRRAV